MAMKVDPENCIDCGACIDPCPNHAVLTGDETWESDGVTNAALSDKHFIAPDRCTECVGYYDAPQCVEACPVDCITKDAAHEESREVLEAKAKRLKPA